MKNQRIIFSILGLALSTLVSGCDLLSKPINGTFVDTSLNDLARRRPASSSSPSPSPTGTSSGQTPIVTYGMSGWTANAGNPVSFTVTRSSGTAAVDVSFVTTNGTAVAGVDYDAQSIVVSMGIGVTSQVVSVPTHINNAQLGKTLNFSANISVGGILVSGAGAYIAEPLAPAPTPTPTSTSTTPAPMPSPSPTPTVTATPTPTSTAAGVDPYPLPSSMGLPAALLPVTMPSPVSSYPVKQAEAPIVPPNFDTSQWIYDGGDINIRTPYFFPDTVGAFRFICKPSHNLYDDPIVYPGQPGASHLHTFFGNTTTNANSTYASLRSNGDGTCAGGPLNRSAYWMPALRIDGGNEATDQIVMPDYTIIYYKMDPEAASVFPRGMRMIFGYNMSNPAASTGFKWTCNATSTSAGLPGDFSNLKAMADAGCPAGSQIEAHVTGPTCWNGQLDSPDHRSHLAEAQYGWWGFQACPMDHPYHFVAFTLGATWTVGPTGPAEIYKMYLSSDRMVAGTIPGSTFHTDWFGAWDDSTLAEWMNKADSDFRNDSGGSFGDGRGLIDPYAKAWNWGSGTPINGYHSLLDLANPRLVNPPAPGL